MDLTINVEEDDLATTDLYYWLQQDDQVVSTTSVTIESGDADGRMGALEMINIALTHLTGLTSVALAYASWRRAKDDVGHVTFKCAGAKVTVHDARPETIQHIIQTLSAKLDVDQGDGSA